MGAPQAAPKERSWPAMVVPLVRRWRTLLYFPLACAVVTSVVVLIATPKYEAHASFTADTGAGSSLSGLGNLASLAGSFGLSTASLGSSTDFFAAALESEAIEWQTLQSRFHDPRAAVSDSTLRLIDILKIRGVTLAERRAKALQKLGKLIQVNVDHSSGVVTLTVGMPTPDLARDVANRMVALLNAFNLKRQQYQSLEQSRFSGQQAQLADSSLRAAEDKLLAFLQANRDVANSPVLQFEQDRLQRRVAFRQNIYTALAQQHAQDQVAAAQDTPVLTVVDSAVAPYWRTSPRRKLDVIFATFLAFLLAVAGVYAVERLRAVRQSAPSDWVALVDTARTAWRQACADARRVARRRR